MNTVVLCLVPAACSIPCSQHERNAKSGVQEKRKETGLVDQLLRISHISTFSPARFILNEIHHTHQPTSELIKWTEYRTKSKKEPIDVIICKATGRNWSLIGVLHVNGNLSPLKETR